MKKKRVELFEGITFNDIVEKIFPQSQLQAVLDKAVVNMMKMKSKLDSVMPAALGFFDLPSASDIKKLNGDVAMLCSRMEALHEAIARNNKRPRKKSKVRLAAPSVKAAKGNAQNQNKPQKVSQPA